MTTARRIVPCIVAVHQSAPDEAPRVLLLQRGATSKYPHQWCIPGGKIEPGESARDCAIREFQEETGLHAPNLLSIDDIDCPIRPELRFSIFVVRFTKEVPRVRIEPGFQGYGWFTKRDIEQLKGVMSPAVTVCEWGMMKDPNE